MFCVISEITTEEPKYTLPLSELSRYSNEVFFLAVNGKSFSTNLWEGIWAVNQNLGRNENFSFYTA